jgi:hypothetical protein
MSSHARKLNFLIEESICIELENLVPAGKRGRVVNEALRKELVLLRRKAAVEQLLASYSGKSGYSNSEIVDFLAKDRATH